MTLPETPSELDDLSSSLPESLWDPFQVGEMAINNELKELIQIQSIKTSKTPSKDAKKQGTSVAAFTSVITCK